MDVQKLTGEVHEVTYLPKYLPRVLAIHTQHNGMLSGQQRRVEDPMWYVLYSNVP